MAEALSRLVGPAAVASGTATILTVTGGHTYTVRSTRIVNTTTGALTILLGIGGVAAANQILPTTTINALSTFQDDSLYVLNAAETLQGTASSTGLTITVSGLDQS